MLRFNFRGVGRSEGEHAHLEGEIEDARAALDWLRARYPELPFALAGFSFGSRVITRLGCAAARRAGCWPAGFRRQHGAADTWSSCAVPKIFIQSTNDQYGPRAEFEAAVRGVRGAQKAGLGGGDGPFLRGGAGRFEKKSRVWGTNERE